MPADLTNVVLLALVFAFLNGISDSGNLVATMISSRAFQPRGALVLAALTAFAGPFVLGVAVARTIGQQIVHTEALSLNMIGAGLAGAMIWGLVTWFFGIPSSSSHALIGGLTGAVIAGAGLDALQPGGWLRVLVALFSSPVLGFIVGFLTTRLIYFLVRGATPGVNVVFKRGQLVTALAMAFSHGTNDASKIMGVITLSLLIAGVATAFEVPFWVIVASAAAFALGTSLGGWRMIRTIGGRFYKIRPLHGFSTQLSAALVILTGSLTGLPVSTSQVVSSAIVGVGSSESFAKVRWSVVGDILTAWLITIPLSGLFAAVVYWLIVNVLVR